MISPTVFSFSLYFCMKHLLEPGEADTFRTLHLSDVDLVTPPVHYTVLSNEIDRGETNALRRP